MITPRHGIGIDGIEILHQSLIIRQLCSINLHLSGCRLESSLCCTDCLLCVLRFLRCLCLFFRRLRKQKFLTDQLLCGQCPAGGLILRDLRFLLRQTSVAQQRNHLFHTLLKRPSKAACLSRESACSGKYREFICSSIHQQQSADNRQAKHLRAHGGIFGFFHCPRFPSAHSPLYICIYTQFFSMAILIPSDTV